MVRKKEMIALPEDYWQAIENKIDGVLIRSKGDALITLLRELQQAKPESVMFDEMIYIKASEFTELKNELLFIKNIQSKQKAVMERVNNLVGKDALAMSDTDLGFALDHIINILKLWEARVGQEGLEELRKMGFRRPVKETTKGAQMQP